VPVSVDEGGKKQRSLSENSPWSEGINDSSNQVVFEEVHPEVILLSYTFFLIPEVPSFELTGELAELLPDWLKEICVSNGWKLDFVTVDPKYLQWALSVPTVVATLQVIKQVRSKLTEHILDTVNEAIELKDPTDLWAHGYLLLHGLHPHSNEVIEQYVRLIREQQQKYSM